MPRRGRKMLLLAIFAFVLMGLILSRILWSTDLAWNRITSTFHPANKHPTCPVCSAIPGARRPPGRLHFLITGSAPNLELCRALVSSTVNRYGAPVISGWQATGDRDAANTHLAKVRVVTEYLEQRIPPDADDDLFLMIDGYHVQLQFGPEVLLKRYFEVSDREDERIIQQLAPANAEKVAGPLGRHVIFGADKVCSPVDWRCPGCWAVPMVPGMDSLTFGPKTDGGNMTYNRPRWLNSGTVMGPVKEVRELFRATLHRIEATYDPHFEHRESDQYYLAGIWGEQEIERINAQLAEDPEAQHPVGPSDAHWPEILPGQKYNYHIAVDYGSSLFQTWAGCLDWVGWYRFDGTGYSSLVDQNVRGETGFRPWDLHLQGDAMVALDRIHSSTDELSRTGRSSNELIRRSEFGVNIVTKTTIPISHCTGTEESLDRVYPRMWFFRHARALVGSALAFFRANEPYAPYPINNRIWYPAMRYPEGVSLDDGGAWSDGSDGSSKMEWLSFDRICGEHKESLFG
ncbi:hypothetical protein SODALDRAFT_344477 [Sodiomyces alkalinus F11]|uniref:Uncharacterized protein n=1 Tax=Sodiomyces alkalinus (strain CBS 110278 / VKM F-3762 / F11) TaxID=1314773 RepID=A0A3N2PVS1_SODAK|nr:hypothetical protein SODALDRAFT_344477 [Sodiomyces alkalinus F11]ROT38574.1 hypothetical protein SODALDRAFT_344477 [Sodiomyces alkalinus F11]